MPELSEEILTEILLRIPAKSLARFKCVSKRWRSQISDTRFARSQLQRAMFQNPYSIARVLLIINPFRFPSISIESLSGSGSGVPPTTILEFPVKAPTGRISFHVVGSCDGLVCVLVDFESLILWNPTTRECRELPSSGLAPLDVEFFYGLGCDSQSDDYKVVRGNYVAAAGGSDSNVTSIEIFSMKTNSWRRIGFEGIEFKCTTIGKYARGFLHWLTTGSESKLTGRIVSFNLSEEKFQEMVPVTGIDDYGTVPLQGICVSGGRLFVYRDDGTHFDAWVMKWDSGESYWTKSCHILRDLLPDRRFVLKLVDITEDGKVVFDLAGWLSLYDPKEDEIVGYTWGSGFLGCATFVESLVSPHSDTPRGEKNGQQYQSDLVRAARKC